MTMRRTVAARFAGEEPGMTYSRTQNPTVQMLEERIAMMEGAEACRAQASGMAAMTASHAVPAFRRRSHGHRARRLRPVPLGDRQPAAALRHREDRHRWHAT
jgi:hypothetical protein